MPNRRDPLTEFEDILKELEGLSPTRNETLGTLVSIRQVESDENIEDSLPDEHVLGTIDIEGEPEIKKFIFSAPPGPVVAVDCGMARLGETSDGLVIALRATIVIDNENSKSQVKLFR